MARGRTICRALAVLRDVLYANPTGRKLRFKSPRGHCPDQVVAELYNVREYRSSGQVFQCGGPASVRRRLIPGEADGVRVDYLGTTLRVRLPEKPPLATAAVVAGALAFVAVFVIGFASGFEPSMLVVGATWAVILAASGAIYVRLVMPVWAGRTDLLIDPFARRLTLPATFGRAEPVSVRFQDVASVGVEEKVVKTDDSETRRFLPTVRYHEDRGDPQSASLAKWTDRERANAFAGWIRGRVGI
jgi:hypothetical protein